jgi:hypothetical protein
MRVFLLPLALLIGHVISAQGVNISGSPTGASNLPPDLAVQIAQLGTKQSDMDTNINRRLDDLGRKLDEVGKTTDGLKTDVAKLGVVSSIFTFGISSVVTIMFTVVIAVPSTFFVQYFLKKKWPENEV